MVVPNTIFCMGRALQSARFMSLGAVMLLVSLFLLPGALAQVEAQYIIQETGSVVGIIQISEGDPGIEYKIDAPASLEDIHIEGGLYLLSNGIFEIQPGADNEALLAYQTQEYTGKAGRLWTVTLPIVGDGPVRIHGPVGANFEPVSGTTATQGDHPIIIVGQDYGADSITLSYSLAPSQMQLPDKATLASIMSIIGIVILALLIISAGYFVYRFKLVTRLSDTAESVEASKATTQATSDVSEITSDEQIESINQMEISEAKKNLMKTFSKNESAIVEVLLDNDGAIRRNQLERQTKIAKSSLASSLAQLERKNIVEVNRDNTVHLVVLTTWFREL